MAQKHPHKRPQRCAYMIADSQLIRKFVNVAPNEHTSGLTENGLHLTNASELFIAFIHHHKMEAIVSFMCCLAFHTFCVRSVRFAGNIYNILLFCYLYDNYYIVFVFILVVVILNARHSSINA